ncbi:MAG: beta-N-acetylhexosaminidase [Candidatus Adiutrix sp.]|jgi:beta-N-acetylhexosaminidase|nr:beta-N-acetylhexosaminidase [Candidatus Adiutrix sp.]
MSAGSGPESSELAEAVGRLLLVGFEGRGLGEVEALLEAVRPAGLIFFARNYPGPEGPAALRRLIVQAQALAGAVFGRPLLMAIDHEGGPVQRLPAPYTRLPAARACSDPAEAERLTELGARELAATGFNFNLAPVVDVPDGPGAFIGERGFSGDPRAVAAWARAVLAAFRRAGLLGAAKHFPGLGQARLDPHLDLPLIPASADRLAATDFLPYRELVGEPDLAAVMTTHAFYPALDADRPATLSPEIVGLLKNELGFGGAVLTDDLEMGAMAKNYDLGEAAVLAVAAGHDLALICRRRENIEVCRRALTKAVQSGRLTESRLADALRRTAGLAERLRAIAVPDARRELWFKTLIGETSTEIAAINTE